MTLPLIYTLNNISKQEKRFIINTIKNDSKNSKKIERIISLVKETKGLEFAESKMNDYYNEALGFLEKIKDSEAKTSLIELVKYVVKEDKNDPKETIDEIFEAAKIEEVVSDFVTLKKRGANLLGLCPFHNEKNSFIYSVSCEGIYKCFGCGEGGIVLAFSWTKNTIAILKL